MVSFSCEACSDVLTKKKLDSHKSHCHGASFTCLDCMVHFMGTDYRSHTSCISEAQKYQGALYRDKPKRNDSHALVPRKAYVEDEDEDEHYASAVTIVEEPPPEAPSPPSAAPGFRHVPVDPVNVFDFYEGSETPNPSTLNLMEQRKRVEDTPAVLAIEGRRSVWFEDEAILEDTDDGALVQYGSGPVPTTEYRTPASKADRDRTTRKERELTRDEKKDKKRKRLHVDTSAERSRSREVDEEMADAPPVLHSGLTGGLNRLLRNSTFPPSPDYSGDAAEPSPGSPLKRSKHAKKVRGRESRRDTNTFSNGIMSLITTRKSKKSSDDRVRKHKKRIREDPERANQKMLEYKPMNGDKAGQDGGQLIVYNGSARAELFLSLVNKGPESERGCSINKTLKRYHRERAAMSLPHGRVHEEKELWRTLRVKRNDRGELVLFCVEK